MHDEVETIGSYVRQKLKLDLVHKQVLLVQCWTLFGIGIPQYYSSNFKGYQSFSLSSAFH